MHAVGDAQVVGLRGGLDPEEHRVLAIEEGHLVVVLRAEVHVRDIAEPDLRGADIAHDQVAELPDIVQRCAGDDRDLFPRVSGAAGGGDQIVGREGIGHVRRGDAARGHPCRVEPGPQCVRITGRVHAGWRDLHASDSVDTLDLRPRHAQHVVVDLLLRHVRATERQPHQCRATAHRLLDSRPLRFRRQQVLRLVHLAHDLRECGVRVEIEPHVGDDRRLARFAGGRHVIDAGRAANRLLQRCRDEGLHHVRRGTGIEGAHRDHGAGEVRKLAYRHAGPGARPQQQDHQADRASQYRATDEKVGELHRGSRSQGCRLLLMTTGMPSRSLFWPAMTTTSPGFRPCLSTSTRSSRSALTWITRARATAPAGLDSTT